MERIKEIFRTLAHLVRPLAAWGKPQSLPCGWQVAFLLLPLLLLGACARMGNPDGGWYDDTPPRIVSTSPADKATGVTGRRVSINFDEYIQIEDASNKVVVSPPQLETPEIKASGKRILVELKDSLKPNTTYTIDFSDAITDNNEGNPLGNYTYSFSTGPEIDTLEVSGYVLDASNLEPVKGILVGLYADLSDTAFTTQPLLRVARTDGRGRFIVKGVAPGTYRAYALQDADGNYRYSQKGEMVAYSHEQFVPRCRPDIRQDTIWRDSLHIDSIRSVGYTRFIPDDIVLKAFTETQTDRYFLKTERKDPRLFTLFFSGGDKRLPEVKGLNFNSDNAFVVEHSLKNDTVNYWLRDTSLVNQDTLMVSLTYMATDTLGNLVSNTDTLDILPKVSYEKRMKDKARKYEEWKKAQDKAKKRGKEYETEMPTEGLEPKYSVMSQPDPDKNIFIDMPTPIARIDTSMIHLYAKHDTLWYKSKFLFRKVKDVARRYEIVGEWRPDVEYSLEIDSTAFTDIYGAVSPSFKQGMKVKSEDEYSSLLMTISGMEDTTVVAQLLDASDKVVKTVSTRNGNAEFFYVNPGTYYMRMFIDSNKNGIWDTGDYAADRQPEETFYYPEAIECKAKWDVTLNWNPTARDAAHQKPYAITKQKPEKDKTIKRRNADRAKKMGIPLPSQY
ncbi:MAG TPA: hypothetical protein DEQ27_00900 [Prevotella sp.]|nr:hypothetical protein [Prevotella sp.]